MHANATNPFPISPTLTGSPGASGGELVQSLTYRESLTPYESLTATADPGAGSLLGHAPYLLRVAAGGAWALVSVTAAGAVLLVLILLTTKVAGWLT